VKNQRHLSKMIDWIGVLRPNQYQIGHFGDVLPSQSLGLVLEN